MELVGIDEAGYGPKIGPLVVAVSKWQFSSGVATPDGKSLDHQLRQAFATHGGSSVIGVKNHLVRIADSKQLYRSRKDLHVLEQGVLPLLKLAGWQGDTFRSLLNFSDPLATNVSRNLPWLAQYDGPVPQVIDHETFSQVTRQLAANLTQLQIQLVQYRAKIIFEPEFNRQLRQLGNKAEVLWQVWTELLRESVIESCSFPAFVLADRQGGRVYYRDLLDRWCQNFGLSDCSVLRETPEESAYRIQGEKGWLEILFSVKGERYLAVAAASMLAKYLREVVLEAFNRFWQARVPHLRATAGYPADAKRFKAAIADVQRVLGIPDDFFWREK
jgi:ribonuclease HII